MTLNKGIDAFAPPGGTNLLGASVRVKRNPTPGSPLVGARPYAPSNNLVSKAPVNMMMRPVNNGLQPAQVNGLNQPLMPPKLASVEDVPETTPAQDVNIGQDKKAFVAGLGRAALSLGAEGLKHFAPNFARLNAPLNVPQAAIKPMAGYRNPLGFNSPGQMAHSAVSAGFDVGDSMVPTNLFGANWANPLNLIRNGLQNTLPNVANSAYQFGQSLTGKKMASTTRIQELQKVAQAQLQVIRSKAAAEEKEKPKSENADKDVPKSVVKRNKKQKLGPLEQSYVANAAGARSQQRLGQLYQQLKNDPNYDWNKNLYDQIQLVEGGAHELIGERVERGASRLAESPSWRAMTALDPTADGSEMGLVGLASGLGTPKNLDSIKSRTQNAYLNYLQPYQDPVEIDSKSPGTDRPTPWHLGRQHLFVNAEANLAGDRYTRNNNLAHYLLNPFSRSGPLTELGHILTRRFIAGHAYPESMAGRFAMGASTLPTLGLAPVIAGGSRAQNKLRQSALESGLYPTEMLPDVKLRLEDLSKIMDDTAMPQAPISTDASVKKTAAVCRIAELQKQAKEQLKVIRANKQANLGRLIGLGTKLFSRSAPAAMLTRQATLPAKALQAGRSLKTFQAATNAARPANHLSNGAWGRIGAPKIAPKVAPAPPAAPPVIAPPQASAANPGLLSKALGYGMDSLRGWGVGAGLDYGYQLVTGEDSPGFALAGALGAPGARMMGAGRLGKFVPGAVKNFAKPGLTQAESTLQMAALPLTLGQAQEAITGVDYISNPLKAMRNTAAAQKEQMAQEMGFASADQMMAAMQRLSPVVRQFGKF